MRVTIIRILLLVCFPFLVLSQEKDFQTWMSISATKKVAKKTNLLFKEGIRFRENSTIRSKVFSDLRIKRKYNKHFSFALGYRFSNDWDNRLNLNHKNRIYSDIYYRKKIKKRFLLNIRARWLTQGNINGYSDVFRNKSSISYNIKKTKLQPEFSLEYFYYFDSMIIEKLRYTFIFSFPISKNIETDISYRIEKDINTNTPETLYIIDGKMSYSF